MPFNVNKCHILQTGIEKQKNDYEMTGTKLESIQEVKDLDITNTSSLKFSQHWKDAAGKANRMLGFIDRNFSFKNKDIILPFYNSLVRPIDYTMYDEVYARSHLEYTVQLWSPHHA